MSVNKQYFSQASTITLAAATETDLLGSATGIDVSKCTALTVGLTNSGSNTIGTITVYLSPLGTTFFPLGINYGPLTAGSKTVIDLSDLASARVRVTATSSSGSSVAAEARGVGPGI